MESYNAICYLRLMKQKLFLVGFLCVTQAMAQSQPIVLKYPEALRFVEVDTLTHVLTAYASTLERPSKGEQSAPKTMELTVKICSRVERLRAALQSLYGLIAAAKKVDRTLIEEMKTVSEKIYSLGIRMKNYHDDHVLSLCQRSPATTKSEDLQIHLNHIFESIDQWKIENKKDILYLANYFKVEMPQLEKETLVSND